MKKQNDNLAEEIDNSSQEEQNRGDDNLAKIVDIIKKDAQKGAANYTDNSIVPEGGE